MESATEEGGHRRLAQVMLAKFSRLGKRGSSALRAVGNARF